MRPGDLRGTAIRVALASLLLARIGGSGAEANNGIFELDGNINDPVPGLLDDWDSVSTAQFTGIVPDPGLKSVFTGGGSKDVNDLDRWKWKDDAGGIPDKNDITHAYAAAYSDNGKVRLYFGADRFDNAGDAQLGFWFFRAPVVASNGSFSPRHTPGTASEVGDILVLVNFTNGGTTPVIDAFEWVSSGGDVSTNLKRRTPVGGVSFECVNGGNQAICAITNSGPTHGWTDYVPKSGTPGTFPPQTFFEGVFTVDAPSSGNVPCFTTFLAETRSSTSETAVLKDFALGTLGECGLEISKTCSNGQYNPETDKIDYDVNVTVDNTGFGTLTNVTVVDELISSDPLVSGATLASGGTLSIDRVLSTTMSGFMNTATVTADSAGGQITDQASDLCPSVDINPEIGVSKSCKVVLAEIDGAVALKVEISGEVCNNGSGPLFDVVVVDDRGTPDDETDDVTVLSVTELTDDPQNKCVPFSMEDTPTTVNSTCPGDVVFMDTVRATADGPLGLPVTPDSATATCALCTDCPNL